MTQASTFSLPIQGLPSRPGCFLPEATTAQAALRSQAETGASRLGLATLQSLAAKPKSKPSFSPKFLLLIPRRHHRVPDKDVLLSPWPLPLTSLTITPKTKPPRSVIEAVNQALPGANCKAEGGTGVTLLPGPREAQSVAFPELLCMSLARGGHPETDSGPPGGRAV